MENTPRMRKPALAASVAVILSLLSSNAAALSLGRLTVQSALGQPLRAEIEIPEINTEEADTLKGTVAAPDAFKAAGLEYNASLSNLQVSLQRRPDGRMVLRLSSERVINEPFVDLILEANWASGRILRDYTLLFDPPNLREAPAPAPTAPQLAAAPSATRAPTAPAVREAPASPQPKAAAQRPTPAAPAAQPAKTVEAKAGRVTVHPGDTASKIAGAHKPPSVSLDQMLVSMLRANPEAFAGNNINRLKSGAVLDLPSSEQAMETTRDEAARTVVAQSKDFNEFRRQLAGAAPSAAIASADRKASGKVQAQVEDKKASVAAPDKLTLSKATAASKAAEEKIASERQAKEAAARAAELARNIAELNKLKAGAAAAAAKPTVTPAVTAPTAPAPAPVVTASAAPKEEVKPAAPAVVASTPVSVPAPVVAAVAAAAKASAPVAAASAAKPAEEVGLLDGMIENPLVPAGTLGIAALLAGFAFYRSRQRKKSGHGESSFLDSHLQPDSFFGASGGEQVDTSNETTATGSSMIYSPSQLDAGGEVDPVAEADVYLAYGRDQQAEDILKDALQATPSRLAIHAKLADIYAKRGDPQVFNSLASTAHTASRGQGAEWEHIRDLGRTLDRDNVLYQDDTPAPTAAQPVADEAPVDAPVAAPVDLDLDFDLDFDMKTPAVAHEAKPSVMGVLHESEFSGGSDEPIELYDAPQQDAAAPASIDFGLEAPAHDVGDIEFDVEPTASVAPEAPTPQPPEPPAPAPVVKAAAPSVASEMLSFDLGSLSLDLDEAEAPPETLPPEEADTDNLDPLSTKLALAREFQSIGDNDGAHALAEEVYTLASGQLRADAKRFLGELGFAQSGFSPSNF